MTGSLSYRAPRPVELDGKTLGALDIGTEDSVRFLDLLTKQLEKRHFLAAVVRVTKPSAAQPCPAEVIEALAGQCDIVVTGACRSTEDADASARDAAALERLSVPCAVVVIAQNSDPDDVPALVVANFREVEQALTSTEQGPGRSDRELPPRNGEVSCEC